MSIARTATRSSIWEMVRAKFYQSQNRSIALIGMTRDNMLKDVNHVRAEEFGGSVYGHIEVSPWSQVLNDDGTASETNFLLFHYSYYDKTDKISKRLIGWGHPVLLYMLEDIGVCGWNVLMCTGPVQTVYCVHSVQSRDKRLLSLCLRTLYVEAI
ncbi:hypothetical protein JG687_00010355 [Phytophthora cactorum]|uniref:Uncharacterized protein n=1 Tax=Phytophthora cactorum TaxID=29920 RepID=A0A8T1U962_9STRA|nr:hypothetical protein JG687_00010355 [Phytophthora cactorum]